MSVSVTIVELADYVADDLGDTSLTTDQIRSMVVKAILRMNRRLEVADLEISIALDADESTAIFPSTNANTLKDFVIMQAECMIAKRQQMEAVSKGIRIRSGADEVDTTAGFGGQRDIVKTICGELEAAFADFIESQSRSSVATYGTLIWHGEQDIYEDVDHNGQFSERKHPFDSEFDDESCRDL